MTHDMDKNLNRDLTIELSDTMAEGTYANLVITTFSQAEFIFDFVNVMPNTAKSKVKARIIMTPQHTKRLMRELVKNIEVFESENGEINDVEKLQLPIILGSDAQA